MKEVREICDYVVNTHFHSETRDNAEAGNREWWAWCDVPDLDPLSLAIGDVIHNLRSALDHLYFQLVTANGETPDRSTYFPIKKDRASYQQDRARFEQQIGSAAAAELDKLEPYPEGSPFLWDLHQLDITDKHKLLVPVATCYRGTIDTMPMADFTKPTATAPFTPGTMSLMTPGESVAVTETPTLLFEVPLTDPKHERITPQFAFDINEPGVVENGPLLAVLELLGDFTWPVIERFKTFVDPSS